MTTNGAAALDGRSAPDSVVGRSASRRGAVVVRGLRKVYPSARRRSWELVRNLRSLGKTILLTTHYMDDAQNLADRVAVLAAGRIVAEGSPETLAGREHGAARVRFRRPTAVAIADLPLPRGVERDSCEMISFRTDTPSRALLPLLSWAAERDVELEGLTVTRPSLEDVYLELTEQLAAEAPSNGGAQGPAPPVARDEACFLRSRPAAARSILRSADARGLPKPRPLGCCSANRAGTPLAGGPQMTFRSLAFLAVAVLGLGGPSTAVARSSTANATTVRVTAKDFSFVLSRKTVAHGRVTFVIRNTGHAMHDFVIAGHRSKTIATGKTTELSVTLKRGRYPYKCTVDSHAELGMKGILRVT